MSLASNLGRRPALHAAPINNPPNSPIHQVAQAPQINANANGDFVSIITG